MKIEYKFFIVISYLFFGLSGFVKAQDTLDYKDIEKQVDKYLTYFSGNNPGAVIGVLQKGEIIFSKAYGMADLSNNQVMSADMLMNIGELSKAFTSLAIMQLVEKGKLTLDQSLSDIIKDFPAYGANIKVRYLLNHASGLKSYNEDSISNNEEVLSYLKRQKQPEFEPGKEWIYSNSDYAILAYIIEKVSGLPYTGYIKKNIFKKIKLENTFFSGELTPEKNVANSHFKEDGVYNTKSALNSVYGEQGIFMNLTDYAKWDNALYTDKLLGCENLQKIFSVEEISGSSRKNYYGYGWALMERNNTRYYWHGGSGDGYTSLVLHLPDTDKTILILTNRNDGYDFLKMAIQIAKLFDKNLKL